MKAANGFGDQTYWNRPTQARQSRLPSKYPSLKSKQKEAKVKPPSRSPSPTSSHSSVRTVVSPSRSAHHRSMSIEEEYDAKDEKSFVKLMKNNLPKFSNEADWEMTIFELSLILERVWPHKEIMDIIDYMTDTTYRRSLSGDIEDRADRLIYFALTTSAKKDSYAKLQILASCHKDAVPCVMKNEGKKLYLMFQALFTMTNLHQASLPTVRAEFYSIIQKENETVLNYSSRVDIIVSTMAKLGERVSTGAWIYALGNGLRAEFKESKDGILYNKDGFNTVMAVKTKLLSEEAVLTSKSKKDASVSTLKKHKQDDEIALASLAIKQKKKDLPPKTPDDSKEKALYFKGKGSKGKGKDIPKSNDLWRTNEFNGTQQWTNWVDPPAVFAEPHHGQWAPPQKGKGRGKGIAKGFDPQTLWCCERYRKREQDALET
jgi:hypothetical protein